MYGGHGAYILQYKGGKFSKIGGSAAAEKYNFRYFAPYKVSGTSIDFKGEPKFMPSQFNNSNYRMVSGVSQFNWNGQSFQLKTRYPVVGGTTTYKTNTGFYTSTSNSSRNTKGIYIPRGSNSQNRENFPSTNIPAVQCMLSA